MQKITHYCVVYIFDRVDSDCLVVISFDGGDFYDMVVGFLQLSLLEKRSSALFVPRFARVLILDTQFVLFL